MPALFVILSALATVTTPPSPTRWVEDDTGAVAESAREALDARLEAYERATGHQIVVWVGKTLDGAPLDKWAVKTFAAWRLGRAGSDDGVALFIFTEDHAIDIEVGYGLEDKVPDAIASRIIHDVMAPKLRANDATGAVAGGADAIITAIEGRDWDPAAATAQPPSVATYVVGGIVALALLLVIVTHPRGFLSLLWVCGRLLTFGLGSRGGFGGRGGRSGGGGARGSW